MADKRFNREQMEAWLASRQTQVFHQYLKDQRDRLMERWAAGEEMDLRYQTKALLLGELADLNFEDYADFYEIEETESEPT